MADILVLEDQKSLGNMMSQFLSATGHNPTLVEDWQSGYEVTKKNKFDLYFLDMSQPNAPIGGLNLREKIQDLYGPARAVLFSSVVDHMNADSALNLTTIGMLDAHGKTGNPMDAVMQVHTYLKQDGLIYQPTRAQVSTILSYAENRRDAA